MIVNVINRFFLQADIHIITSYRASNKSNLGQTELLKNSVNDCQTFRALGYIHAFISDQKGNPKFQNEYVGLMEKYARK